MRQLLFINSVGQDSPARPASLRVTGETGDGEAFGSVKPGCRLFFSGKNLSALSSLTRSFGQLSTKPLYLLRSWAKFYPDGTTTPSSQSVHRVRQQVSWCRGSVMKYFLIILYLNNMCADPSSIKVKEYSSYFDCDKQLQAEARVKDSKFPYKKAYCASSPVGQ